MDETILTKIQASLVSRLQSESYFSTITVLDERRGDLDTELKRLLGTVTVKAGKFGLCVIVRNPTATDRHPDCPGGPLRARFAIRILEQPSINQGASGTGKLALDVARMVILTLKHFRAIGLHQPLVVESPSIVPIYDEPVAPTCYDAYFTTEEAGVQTFSKVLAPTIGGTSAAVSLACGTASAAIYYTTDNSHPWSGNATATLYTVPFAVTAGKTVRAGAYKTNLIASDINAQTF